MKLVKKILCCLLACLMILSVSGCTNTASDTTKEEPKVTLKLWTPRVFEVGYMDALEDLISRFTTEHPNVTIEKEEINWDGIGEKLETAMMTNSTPDIYIDGTARTAKLPSTGLVEDLTSVINGLDNWNESAASIGVIDGKHYLVPMTQMPPTTLCINADLAKQYGAYDLLPKDRYSWTWDDFMAFLEKCAESSVADDVYPMGLFAGSQSSDIAYYTMILAAGGSVLNEDHTACVVNDAPAQAVLGYLQKMVEDGLAHPGCTSMTDEDELSLFLSQKLIVEPTSGALSIIPVFDDMVAQGLIDKVPDLETYAYPTLNGSKNVNGNWGANCIAVFTNEGDANKIAAAKEFISFMMNDKAYVEALWAASPGYAPTREFGQELHLSSEMLAREAAVYSTVSAFNNSAFGILEPYWGEIRQYFYPELQSLYLGSKTPEQALADFASNVTRILEENNK